MEWLTNVLTEMEISVEQQERIVGTVKENLRGFVPAHRFNEVNEAKKQLLAELEQHKSVDADALTQQIVTLKGQLQDTHFKHALQTAANVGNMKCKDLDVLTGLIDKTKIKMNEDGTFEGLSEQIGSIQQNKSYLFEQQSYFKGIQPAEGKKIEDQQFSRRELENMTPEEVAQNWNAIRQQMESGNVR